MTYAQKTQELLEKMKDKYDQHDKLSKSSNINDPIVKQAKAEWENALREYGTFYCENDYRFNDEM